MSHCQEMSCPSDAVRSVGKTPQRVREAQRKQNKPLAKVSPGEVDMKKSETENRWWCLGDVSLGLPRLYTLQTL